CGSTLSRRHRSGRCTCRGRRLLLDLLSLYGLGRLGSGRGLLDFGYERFHRAFVAGLFGLLRIGNLIDVADLDLLLGLLLDEVDVDDVVDDDVVLHDHRTDSLAASIDIAITISAHYHPRQVRCKELRRIHKEPVVLRDEVDVDVDVEGDFVAAAFWRQWRPADVRIAAATKSPST